MPKTPVRTDEERATGAPLKIILGGEPKPVRPLVLRVSREWKLQVIEALARLSGKQLPQLVLPGGSISLDGLGDAFALLATDIPDQIEALVLGYLKLADPSLDPQWVADHATDEEMTDALWAFLECTFPFFARMDQMISLVRKATG
jgi:hypothetical protein